MKADDPEDDPATRLRSPVVPRFDPAAGVIPGGTGIERRDIDAADLAASLRAAFELPPLDMAPGGLAVAVMRPPRSRRCPLASMATSPGR